MSRSGQREDSCVGCGKPFVQASRDPFEREVFCPACILDPTICRQNEPPTPNPRGWLTPTTYTQTHEHELTVERALAGDSIARGQIKLDL